MQNELSLKGKGKRHMIPQGDPEHPDRQKMESLQISKPLNDYSKDELKKFNSTFGFRVGKKKHELIDQLSKKMAALGMEEPQRPAVTEITDGTKKAAGGSSRGQKRSAEYAENVAHASAAGKKRKAAELEPGMSPPSSKAEKKSGRGQKLVAEDDAHTAEARARLKEEEKERARQEKERARVQKENMRQMRTEEAQKAQKKLDAQQAKYEKELRAQATVLQQKAEQIQKLEEKVEASESAQATSAAEKAALGAGAATNAAVIAAKAPAGQSNSNILFFS